MNKIILLYNDYILSYILFIVSPENILTTTPTNISATRGQNIVFNCSTDAGPDTIYVWLYNIGSVCTDDQSACVKLNLTDEGQFVI